MKRLINWTMFFMSVGFVRLFFGKQEAIRFAHNVAKHFEVEV